MVQFNFCFMLYPLFSLCLSFLSLSKLSNIKLNQKNPKKSFIYIYGNSSVHNPIMANVVEYPKLIF